VAKAVKQLFNLPLAPGSVNRLKEAGRFEPTYRAILERVVMGRLVHADETKVEIDGKDRYVWVLTNLEDVAFTFLLVIVAAHSLVSFFYCFNQTSSLHVKLQLRSILSTDC
jgi:transposase IS66 family protein